MHLWKVGLTANFPRDVKGPEAIEDAIRHPKIGPIAVLPALGPRERWYVWSPRGIAARAVNPRVSLEVKHSCGFWPQGQSLVSTVLPWTGFLARNFAVGM